MRILYHNTPYKGNNTKRIAEGGNESKVRIEVEEKTMGEAHSTVQLQLKTSTKIAKPIPLFDFGLELRPLNSIFSFDLKHTTNSCIWSLEGVFVIIEGI